MLTSLAYIFLVGLSMAAICQKLNLPRIIGMLFTGNGNVIGVIFAAAIVAFILYMLFKPYKESSRFTANVKVKA